MDEQLRDVVRAATDDLVARTPAGKDVVVITARRETFRDGSLGCSRPGRRYDPAPVEGFRVVLRRGDRAWLFTAGADGLPRQCPSGEKDGGQRFVPPPRMDI